MQTKPFFHKASGRWRVRLDGCDTYYPDEQSAMDALEGLRGSGDAIEVPGEPGSAQWWRAALREVAVALLANPGDDNLIKTGRVLSQMCAAGRAVADLEEMEVALGELEAWRRGLDAARQHGTRIELPGGTSDGPGITLSEADSVH